MKHLLEAYFSYLEKSPNKNFLLFLTTWLVIQISYWGFSLPYYFIIKSKALEKYKIQPKVAWTEEEKKKGLQGCSFQHRLINPPSPCWSPSLWINPFPQIDPSPFLEIPCPASIWVPSNRGLYILLVPPPPTCCPFSLQKIS